ncbi:MAG: alginate export family protein, partial [Nitrosospira sp.]
MSMRQQAVKYRSLGLAAMVLAMAMPVTASEYKPLRFDEDWGQVCDKVRPKCWHIHEAATLTFGADGRIRAQHYGPDNFGIGRGSDSHILFRGQVHGDLRVGKHVQAFVQLGAYDEAGRAGGPVSTDQSNPDLQQGFLAWNGDMFSLRVGRQEMTLGTSRLVSVREGPNIRLAFDGVRTSWSHGSHRIDGFAFRPVLNRPGAFDDSANKSQA